MTPEDLREEVDAQLELIQQTLNELLALQEDVQGREPSVREKTAAAAFLAQICSGLENILKRISHFCNVPLPAGDAWHVELFRRFCVPPHEGLPAIFDESLASTLAPYRKFRHAFFHGYGTELEWSRMVEGIQGIEDAFERFKTRVLDFLRTIQLC